MRQIELIRVLKLFFVYSPKSYLMQLKVISKGIKLLIELQQKGEITVIMIM